MSVIRSSRGFTLIELLIVMVVISILATIAFTGFTRVRKSATNATIVDAARAYKQALELYLADFNTYPPMPVDRVCLGIGYPDRDGDGKGDCGVANSNVEGIEDEAFMTALKPYIGQKEATVNITGIALTAPYDWRGIQLAHSEWSTNNGQPARYVLFYHLDGASQQCKLSSSTPSPADPAYVTSTTGYAYSVLGTTACLIFLPEP
jgi:prepilin-type N-terminal cleavage/methylation domain-containing protein